MALEWPTNKHVKHTVPRALSEEEISVRIVNDYREAAKAAKRCGFDAVRLLTSLI